jgi:hypothetical protein
MAESVGTIGGIPLAPNDHLCVFYRGRRECEQLVVPFVRDGLASGHVCYVIASAGNSLGFSSATLGSHLLQLVEPEGFYLTDGEFRPAAPVESLHQWSRSIFEEGGAEFARVATDMSWAGSLVDQAFIDELVRYELTATEWARTYPRVAVCLYDLDVFGGDVVVPIIKAHPKAWMGGSVVENPYYWAP